MKDVYFSRMEDKPVERQELVKGFEVRKDEAAQAICDCKVAMRNREHIVAMRPDGNELMLHTMHFSNEIQQVKVKSG